VFAVRNASMQIGRTLFVLWASAARAPGRLSNNFQRIACLAHALRHLLGSSAFLAEPGVRLAWWTLALGIELGGSVGRCFWVPGLGRSSVTDWNVDGGHMAERCAPVRHHRPRRVAARHRSDVRRADVGCADADRILQRRPRQHPDVVAVFDTVQNVLSTASCMPATPDERRAPLIHMCTS
jgi:hypothetical protein